LRDKHFPVEKRSLSAVPRPRIYRTNAERQAAYRRRLKSRSLPIQFRSKTDEWETPEGLFAELDAEFHCALDVCANPDNAKCDLFFTRYENGLVQKWEGVCWTNPLYGLALRQWVKKAYESAQVGATVVALLPARTDTQWWHDYVLPHADIRYIRGHMKFNGVENSAPVPSAIVIFRPPLAQPIQEQE
jgi:phage N-6-adenine-methyltransferase